MNRKRPCAMPNRRFRRRRSRVWGGLATLCGRNGSGGNLAAEPRRRRPVRRLGGRFALNRELGSGGMSVVFLGRDEVLDRPVAVKILNSQHGGTDIGARFRREGRTAARLSHPNIVQVYDAGEDELEGRE